MLVFARVVQAGSFTTAAAQLGMPKSTVSRKVTELEERLGARLLQRTTRKLSLTDAGRIYYEYSARIAGEVEDAERAVCLSRFMTSPHPVANASNVPREIGARDDAPSLVVIAPAVVLDPPL